MAMHIKHKVHKHTQTLHTYIMPPPTSVKEQFCSFHISVHNHTKKKRHYILETTFKVH